jgi:hypothetical protein
MDNYLPKNTELEILNFKNKINVSKYNNKKNSNHLIDIVQAFLHKLYIMPISDEYEYIKKGVSLFLCVWETQTESCNLKKFVECMHFIDIVLFNSWCADIKALINGNNENKETAFHNIVAFYKKTFFSRVKLYVKELSNVFTENLGELFLEFSRAVYFRHNFWTVDERTKKIVSGHNEFVKDFNFHLCQ